MFMWLSRCVGHCILTIGAMLHWQRDFLCGSVGLWAQPGFSFFLSSCYKGDDSLTTINTRWAVYWEHVCFEYSSSAINSTFEFLPLAHIRYIPCNNDDCISFVTTAYGYTWQWITPSGDLQVAMLKTAVPLTATGGRLWKLVNTQQLTYMGVDLGAVNSFVCDQHDRLCAKATKKLVFQSFIRNIKLCSCWWLALHPFISNVVLANVETLNSKTNMWRHSNEEYFYINC